MPPGWRLAVVAATASTNADLVRAAAQGAAEGTALFAHVQHAGRGRQGRVWHSPAGNLHLSVILRPACGPGQAGQIGMLAALAVADLLQGLGIRPLLKWPNDVLVNDAKIAGILVETACGSTGIDWAVVGIGLNVGRRPIDVPYAAVALADLPGPAPEAVALAPPLLAHLAARYAAWRAEGFAPHLRAWRTHGPMPGEATRVRIGGQVIAARFRDLDPDGALVVEVAPGQPRRITAGEWLAG